jgi:glycosyltransferase involved in cell wall biosynthesis
MALRLGFHYHVPAFQKEDGIYTPGYQGRFVDSLAAHCDRLVLFLHTPQSEEAQFLDYRIQSTVVELVPIGPHTRVPLRMLQAWRYVVPQVRRHRAGLDAILLRGPSPLLPIVAWAAQPVPTVLLLVGDYLAGIDDSQQPGWRRELIRAWALWNRWGQDRVARRSLTFVNGRKLYEELKAFVPALLETRTTTLSESDFFVREDACAAPPYHLLYTGRMAAEKGLLDLVEAVALLLERGEDVVLDLVGWPDREDSFLKLLREHAGARGVADRIRYHGYKPIGPELFAFYQQADIFVIASRSSEGFPRSVWEAMAHSLPVVTTEVGSIPYFVAGAALLVPPGRPDKMADAISLLLHSPSQRQEQIQRGLALARTNTLEYQVGRMVSLIQEYIAT